MMMLLLIPLNSTFYPKSINDWYEKGIAKKIKWMFLEDLEEAAEAKDKGEASIQWVPYKIS